LSLGTNTIEGEGGMLNKAFIMPHPPIIISEVGRGKEKEAKATIEGCIKAAEEIARQKPDTIIVISPHGPSYSNAVCVAGESTLKGDLRNFGVWKLSYEFQNDLVLADRISGEINNAGTLSVLNDSVAQKEYGINPAIDHGALVPLYFVQDQCNEFKLVHISTGISDPVELYKCGMAIRRASEGYDNEVILIASSDLSHRLTSDGPYEYNPEGPKYDRFVVECIRERKFMKFLDVDQNMRECAGECGHRAMTIALGLFESRDCRTEVFSYEGPFGVGYMTAMLVDGGPGDSILEQLKRLKENKMTAARENESPYVKLARETIEQYIKFGSEPEKVEIGGERRGTFVSIKKNGRLRGCIGTTGPTEDCVENEIIDNAIKAATQDPRFSPITEDELQDLVISVDVLFPPEKIESRDMLDVKEYGVIVSKGFRKGLLLPNLEGIDTVDDQIRIALQKGGISPDENFKMERFRVVRYK
jgi:AmmeMemoRadiSam system protein A